MDLTLEILGWVESLEDALTQFTSPEDLDGENMYRCGRFVDLIFVFLFHNYMWFSWFSYNQQIWKKDKTKDIVRFFTSNYDIDLSHTC